MSPEFDPLEKALRDLPEPDAPHGMADIIAARVKHQARQAKIRTAKPSPPTFARRSWTMLISGAAAAGIGARFIFGLLTGDLPELPSLFFSEVAWFFIGGRHSQLDFIGSSVAILCGVSLLLLMGIWGQASRSAGPRI